MPIVGHIAETGMAAGAEFRGGPVSPNARNCEFVRQCERALPRGVKVHRARIDAAGYQARIINHFTNHGIGYAIRARLDASVAGQTGALDESRWQPFIERDGAASLAQGGCIYRALATSFCRWSDSRAVR